MHPKPDTLTGPIIVERQDLEDGLIVYEIWDNGRETYHQVCHVSEETSDNALAEAEFIALALNNAIGALKAIKTASLDEPAT